jgi:hypothetical protein
MGRHGPVAGSVSQTKAQGAAIYEDFADKYRCNQVAGFVQTLISRTRRRQVLRLLAWWRAQRSDAAISMKSSLFETFSIWSCAV